MTYQVSLNRHLAEYKRSVLRITEPGVFRYRGRDVVRDHILPAEEKMRNVLPFASSGVYSMLKKNPRLKLHKYFHHLNSSQAFAFNLFVPYFDRGSNAAQVLLGALGQDGRLLEWNLESIPDTQEETNIDVTWKTDDGSTTICEVKLSESELGTAKSNRRRDRKLAEIYRPALLPHVAEELLEPKAFFDAYQFLRNVWHLVQHENSRLVFLVPQSNGKVWNRLQELVPFVSEASKRRISIVSMEGVIQQLMRTETDLELREHAASLHRKYMI